MISWFIGPWVYPHKLLNTSRWYTVVYLTWCIYYDLTIEVLMRCIYMHNIHLNTSNSCHGNIYIYIYIYIYNSKLFWGSMPSDPPTCHAVVHRPTSFSKL